MCGLGAARCYRRRIGCFIVGDKREDTMAVLKELAAFQSNVKEIKAQAKIEFEVEHLVKFKTDMWTKANAMETEITKMKTKLEAMPNFQQMQTDIGIIKTEVKANTKQWKKDPDAPFNWKGLAKEALKWGAIFGGGAAGGSIF